ncbi:hypothetical protein HGRIS_003436 [Hohenbuehelia grisea]|uniref:Protein kinase domain-containing protein n=1 Tax=Hohenbuehelia grisea TaxID=104357 RepID=A0ABR3JGD5_9AGAR
MILNIVHTDIKQDNIMFDVYGNSAPNFLAANVILSDFNTAMPPRGDHQSLIQPVALRSPEVIAGCEWGVKADIWNLGCIVFELLSGHPLFNPKPMERDDGGMITATQVHFAHIYSHVWADNEQGGRLLIHFAGGSHFLDLFDYELLKLKFGVDRYQSLQEVLQVYDLFTQELHDFLMSMLRIHPDDRLCARELLKHPWLCI